MTKPYVPVQLVSPADMAGQKQTGIMLLGETKQGLIEPVNDRASALALPFLSKYRRIVSVALGTMTIDWSGKFPSKDAVREFIVDVSTRVSPIDPPRLAGAAGYDFRNDIVTEITDELRQITRRYESHEVAEVENAMRKSVFNKKVVAGCFDINFGAFFVRMDQAILNRKVKADDANVAHHEKIKDLERRTELAHIVYQFLPDIPSRSAVAFDLANDPNRITQYVERIEQAYGEQQRQTIEKLEKLAELFRHGNLDAVDLASLIGKVIQTGNPTLLPAGPRKALPSS